MPDLFADVLPDSRLPDYLPILGHVAILHHRQGHCLASIWINPERTSVIETRLSTDFPTDTLAYAFYEECETRLAAHQPFWPLIEHSCRQTTPLAVLLAHQFEPPSATTDPPLSPS